MPQRALPDPAGQPSVLCSALSISWRSLFQSEPRARRYPCLNRLRLCQKFLSSLVAGESVDRTVEVYARGGWVAPKPGLVLRASMSRKESAMEAELRPAAALKAVPLRLRRRRDRDGRRWRNNTFPELTRISGCPRAGAALAKKSSACDIELQLIFRCSVFPAPTGLSGHLMTGSIPFPIKRLDCGHGPIVVAPVVI